MSSWQQSLFTLPSSVSRTQNVQRGSKSISIRNQRIDSSMSAAKDDNKHQAMPSNSLPNNGIYQINTNSIDIVTERSAITKNVSNSKVVNNTEFYQPLISDNQVPSVSTANQNLVGGKKMIAPGYFPGRAGLQQSAIRMSTALNATPDGTNDETKSEGKVEEAPAQTDEVPFSNYSWFVLALIVSVRIVYQWQRSIFSYCYGYQGTGLQKGNPVFEISSAYPQLAEQFGFLTGFAYTIPFAFMGLYWGGLTNKVNRKWVISIAMAVSALTMGSVGFVNSFAVLAASRFILGFVSSIFNPMSFSLLTDYFPADKRATANSIVQSGNYVGWGLSSISIMAIKNYGWRTTYGFLGAAALAVSALFAIFVKDPRAQKLKVQMKQNKSDSDAQLKKEKESGQKATFSDLLKNPVNKWCLIGTFFRNFGGSITTYYLPVFFLKNYPLFKIQYAFMNSVVLSVLGLTSGILGGIIADKFEKNSLWTKALIPIIGSAAAVPLIAVATLYPSFWMGMGCFSLFTLLASAFSGPAITMMQNTTQKSLQGSIISTYFFTITAAQTLGPLILSKLAKYYGAVSNPILYGPIITGMVLVGFGGSVPFWYLAGKEYKKQILAKKEAEKAIAPA